MIKASACALLVTMAFAPKDYPLRMKILEIENRHGKWGVSGQGRANLKDEDGQIHGIDFAFEGCNGYRASIGPTSYRVRRKKPLRLGVLGHEIGSDKTDECEFKYTSHNFVYVMKDGLISTRPLGVSTE